MSSVLEWGRNALAQAASGKQDSAHIDVFLGDQYSKRTAVDDCLVAMDHLLEVLADECMSKRIMVVANIDLSYSKHMVISPPPTKSLFKHLSNTPPEIYFLPRQTPIRRCIIDGEEYTCSYPLTTDLDQRFGPRHLFSFYRCWRGREAIANDWMEYERDILRVFEPTGELLTYDS